MGKDTGFIEYKREANGDIPPLERIKNFKEFHSYLNDGERKNQAARCMNCGVPMCQSALRLKGMVTGCPLHNFIPEWNDALYKEQFDMAAWRLFENFELPRVHRARLPRALRKGLQPRRRRRLGKRRHRSRQRTLYNRARVRFRLHEARDSESPKWKKNSGRRLWSRRACRCRFTQPSRTQRYGF